MQHKHTHISPATEERGSGHVQHDTSGTGMLTRLLLSAAAQAYCNCHTETQRLLCKSSTPAQGTPNVQVARQDGSGGCAHRVICSYAPGIATLRIKLPKPLVESCAAPLPRPPGAIAAAIRMRREQVCPSSWTPACIPRLRPLVSEEPPCHRRRRTAPASVRAAPPPPAGRGPRPVNPDARAAPLPWLAPPGMYPSSCALLSSRERKPAGSKVESRIQISCRGLDIRTS